MLMNNNEHTAHTNSSEENNGLQTEVKGNILEMSKVENGKVKKAGLYLFNKEDAIAMSNFQDEKYSSPEKFAELTAAIPERFVIK